MASRALTGRARARQVLDSPCQSVMASKAIKGHLHRCGHKHSEHEDHFCPDCQRWWGTK